MMRKMVFAVPLVLTAALGLSACGVSLNGGGHTKEPNTAGANENGNPGAAAVSDEPVQQPGESDSSFVARKAEFTRLKGKNDQFTYDCHDGPWSSTGSGQTVILRGHCTDVNITHGAVNVWIPNADRVNIADPGNFSSIVANRIGDIVIGDDHITVFAGALGDVTVAPVVVADDVTVHTGTVGDRVTIQADRVKIFYDQGSPSVTTTGKNTNVKQN